MRLLSSILFLLIGNVCIAQDNLPVHSRDTLIPFNSTNLLYYSFWLGDRDKDTRVIMPRDSSNPLYVKIPYEHSTAIRYEYFRLSPTTYEAIEYFTEIRKSNFDGVKSRGSLEVMNSLTDSFTTSIIDLADGNQALELHYFKTLSREGKWIEVEDSVSFTKFSTGYYRHNRRVGRWKHFITTLGDDFLLEETDYDMDTTQPLYSTNIARTASISTLKEMLSGRWIIRSCDNEKEQRMLYSKCATYNGSYGDDCNNKWDRNNYYDFGLANTFVRQRGEGCNSFRESAVSGKWDIKEMDGQRYITLKFTDGEMWNLCILYIDAALNLITERL